MIPCAQRDQLQDYVDRELAAPEALRFEEHLAGCAACAADLELFQKVSALAESLPLFDPPASLTERVLDRVLPSRARRRAFIRRAGLAYAGALAACLATLGALALQPGSLTLLSALGVTASRRLVQIAVFTVNAGSSTLLDLVSGWGLVSSAGARLAPFGRAIATVFGRPSVSLTLWLAAVACAALIWWMRPRRDRQGGRMRHVGVLGF